MGRISRRNFLRIGAVSAAGAAAYPLLNNLKTVQSLVGGGKDAVIVENPLAFYPNRDWESVYRDQYAYDDSFTFVCAPNDTHNCRLRAFTRNGVMQRIEQAYDVDKYADQMGNTATPHWLPRGCAKGFTFHRRVYGPYRLKAPLVRVGWRDWAEDGFPELTPANRDKYKFTSRGTDSFT